MFPEQQGQQRDAEQYANAEAEQHRLRHEQHANGAQLLLFDFIAEEFESRTPRC